MHAALNEHWPNARVQRCLVHLQRNIRKYVTTLVKNACWSGALGARAETYPAKTRMTRPLGRTPHRMEWAFLYLTKERSYRKTAPEVPSWVRETQQWWYTHQRLRSGYQVLRRAIDRGHLFTFLDKELQHLSVPLNNEWDRGWHELTNAAPVAPPPRYERGTSTRPRPVGW